MTIELVGAIPGLVDMYTLEVSQFIKRGLITEEEWNTKFKHFRDNCGYSIIHYLTCVGQKDACFVTANPIMLDNREELEARFNVPIKTMQDMVEEAMNDGH